jgi:hypothetical protein
MPEIHARGLPALDRVALGPIGCPVLGLYGAGTRALTALPLLV